MNGFSLVPRLANKMASAWVTSRDLDPLLAAMPADAATTRTACAADGFVRARATRGDGGDGFSDVFAGALLAERPTRVALWLSAVGTIVVYAGDERVASFDEIPGTGKRPYVDEHRVELDLRAGTTRLTIVSGAPADKEKVGGFYARLRGIDGGPVRGVAFTEASERARCTDAALLTTDAAIRLEAGEVNLEVTPRYRGLAPIDDVPITAGLASANANAIPGARTTLVKLAAAARAPFDVEVRVGPNVATTLRVGAPFPLLQRIAAAEARAEKLQEPTFPRTSIDAFRGHVAMLEASLTGKEVDVPWLERQTKIVERLAQSFADGNDPYPAERGVVYRAYTSQLDGRIQRYVTFVPRSYDAKKPAPLVVVTHGRDRLPEHALRTVIGQAPDEHMTLRFAAHNLPTFPDFGAILVAPWTFDEGGPHPLGEADVLAVIDDMKAAYAIDARRVSITGVSLGGTVSFVLPLHYPDVFAAAAPLCGYPNLLDYKSVSSVEKKPWEDALLAKKYIVNYAENGVHVPLHIVHGGKDVPGRSKVVADRYRALGQRYVFDVQEDLDHNVWDYAYEDGKMIPWLRNASVPERPRRARLVTGEYRYDRAHWLRLVAMHDASSRDRAELDGTITGATIEVRTANVDAFEILLDRVDPKVDAGAFEVKIDDATLRVEGASGVARFERDAGGPFRLVSAIDRTGKKKHGVSGPLDDSLRHPLVVVYGTRDPSIAEANRLAAEHFSRASGLGDVRYPMLSDIDAASVDLSRKSVLFVGTPAQNAALAPLAAGLPVTFEPGAIVVRGQSYRGDAAVSFVAPHPQNPDEYVVVHAGLTESAARATRYLPRYLPDWVVYDTAITRAKGGLLFGARPVLAGGFFTEAWK